MVTLRLLISCLRYRHGLAHPVRAQVRRWQCEAQALADHEDRIIALRKLSEERFNAEAAAMAATVCPAGRRRLAAEAIVSLELMFDCLDGLTERPSEDPLREGERLHAPFVSCFAPRRASTRHISPSAPRRDASPDRASIDGYLRRLSHDVSDALAALPGHKAIADVAMRCASHAAGAQVRMHAATIIGPGEIETWARREARLVKTQPWQDFAAGAACSVLTLHALIAAAADPNVTEVAAERICAAYTPLGAAVTLLDGLIDAQQDALDGRLSYAGLYETREQLAGALLRSVREAKRRVSTLPNARHHEMIAASALAYEISSVSPCPDTFAAAIVSKLVVEQRVALRAPLRALRAWRALRQTSEQRLRRARGDASRPRQLESSEPDATPTFAHPSKERSLTC